MSCTVLCLESQSCPTLCKPMNWSPPGSSVHGVLQARILEWAAFASSRGSSQPTDPTQVSCIAGGFFTIWATREAQEYWSGWSIPFLGELPDPGIEPRSPTLQTDSLPAELPGKPVSSYTKILKNTSLESGEEENWDVVTKRMVSGCSL